MVRSPALSALDSDVQTAGERPTVAWSRTVSPTLRRLFEPETSVFGIRLGDFVIESRIGVGGMGAVFRAHDTRLSRKVALKVLSPTASVDPQLVQRFHNEARATARLNHDNIARVFSSGETLGVHYIVYELVDGVNLRDLIAAHGLVSAGDAVNYLLQVAMALNHMAAAGVVHRDIKPSNMIITPEGRARLVDLGLARKEGEDSIGDLTVAGSTLGTFDYISPEQAQDPRNVDVRSDIYSLGCTAFHMLTGQAPYPDGTALQKLLDHRGKNAPAPHEVNRKVPRDLSAVVHRMMASEPDDRYATPALLVEDLMRIAARMGLRGIQPEGLVWKRQRETRPPFLHANFGWIVMATLLMLAAIFLRLQPQSLDTDFRFSQMVASRPEPTVSESPTSVPQPGQSQGTDNPGARVFEALSRTLWPEGGFSLPAATQPSSEPSGWSVFSDLGGLVASLRDAFGRSLKLRPGEMASASAPATASDAGPVRMATGPRISLQSQPDTEFTTLEGACWAAEDGDVVVVRPSRGGTPLLEKPIRIVKKSITIRGESEAGRVPVIRFDVGAEPTDTLSRMITVVGGGVTMTNLDIQVVARSDVGAGRWALCALEGADRARLDRVNVDFLNPDGQEAVVFEVTLGADAAMARMREDAPGDYEIRLAGGFVRGDCGLIHIETALPGSLDLSRSVVGIAQPMVSVIGTDDQLLARDRIDVELNHVTCVLADGLLRMTDVDSLGGPTRKLLPVRFVVENSIFASSTDSPLVAMSGTSAPEQFRSLLTWVGSKNLYDGFRVFWRVDSSLAGLDVFEDSFDDWKASWSATADAGEVGATADHSPWLSTRWRQLTPDRIQLTDLLIDETDSSAPAVGTATDGGNLGAPIATLRRLATAAP